MASNYASKCHFSLVIFCYRNYKLSQRQYFLQAAWLLFSVYQSYRSLIQKNIILTIQKITLLHIHSACNGANPWPRVTYKQTSLLVLGQGYCLTLAFGLWPPVNCPHSLHMSWLFGILLSLCCWIFHGLFLM